MKWNKLEDRMLYYRGLCDYKLPVKSYVIMVLDGRSFSHQFKNKLEKPFDTGFIEDMNETAKYLCSNISGALFAFVQSDEISIFVCDYDTREKQAWFDYRLCKINSLAASMAASKFNQLRMVRKLENQKCEGFCDEFGEQYKQTIDGVEVDKDLTIYDQIRDFKLAEFDCRAFVVPTQNDAFSWFLFRQLDCVRNSISMAAQTYFSPKELHKKNTDQMQELLFQEKNINWNDYPIGQKRGRLITKKKFVNGKEIHTDFQTINNQYSVLLPYSTVIKTPLIETFFDYQKEDIIRNKWIIDDAPLMNSEEGKKYMLNLIPLNK